MSRDYKSRASSRSEPPPAPAWIWFAGGLTVGLFVAALAWLKLESPAKAVTVAPSRVEAPQPQPQPAPAPVREAREEKAPPPKPRFDFYTILPEMEVVVPDPDEDAPAPVKAPVVEGQPALVKAPDAPPTVVTAPATAAAAPAMAAASAAAATPAAAAPATSYILQMGSFRRHEDADRLKASLALVGVTAEIQRVSVGNGETYFRVRSGPYSNPKQINELRARLEQNKISSLLIKLK